MSMREGWRVNGEWVIMCVWMIETKGGQVTHPVDSPTKQQNFFLPLPQQEQNTFLLFSY